MKKYSWKNGGFTLIELLVVVLIIGILAAVAVPQYQKAVWKARLSEDIINIRTLQRAADAYVLAHDMPTNGYIDLTDKLDVTVENSIYSVGWDEICREGNGISIEANHLVESEGYWLKIEKCNNEWGDLECLLGPDTDKHKACDVFDTMYK